MDQIYRLKDSIFAYLSPSRRRHTIQGSTPKGKENLVLGGRVGKKRLSLSDTKKMADRQALLRRRNKNDGHSEVTSTELTPDDSVSQIDVDSDILETVEESESDEENSEVDGASEELSNSPEDESEYAPRDKVAEFLKQQESYEERMRAIEEREGNDWSEDELELYKRIAMRGYEPLMHTSFMYDFATCPLNLFTNDTEKIVFHIRGDYSTANFAGMRALLDLCAIGPRVRDMTRVKKPQEPYIKREIKRYMKWAERDGGYHDKRFLPVYCITSGRKGKKISTLVDNTKAQMNFLAQRHRDHLAIPEKHQGKNPGEYLGYRRKPPVIYGLIILQMTVVMVTLDSSKPGADMKIIADFKFDSPPMDMWTSFAIGILVIAVRNYTMMFNFEYEADEKVVYDPDL